MQKHIFLALFAVHHFFHFTNPCTNTFFCTSKRPAPLHNLASLPFFHNFSDGPSLMRGGRGADIVCLRGPIIREGQVQLWTDIFPLKNKCE